MISRRALAAGLIVLVAGSTAASGEPPPAAFAPPPPSPPAPAPPPNPTPPGPPSTPAAAPAAPSTAPSTAADPGQTATVRADRAAGITTPIWREPDEPLDLPWHILSLPEYVVELLFTPLGFVVGLVERDRVDRRIFDFLRNDAGTVKVVPTFKFSGGDGLGLGASLELQSLLGRGEKLEMGGVVLVNRDYKLAAGYEQSFASLDGRTLETSLEYELNQDLDFYGIGNDTRKADHRVIERRGIDAIASMEVFSRASHDSYGLLELGYQRATTGRGSDANADPVGEPGDTVPPPADFDRATSHALVGLVMRHDSRDTPARTQRGVLAEVRTRLSTGLDKANFSALSIGGQVTGYVPVLPLYRVLVGSLAVEGVLPPYGNGEIPLDEYVLLGRKDGLRGFPNYRFRDQLGWWGSLEYRYPIYRYQDSPFVLSPGLFADVGRVASTFTELWQPTFHWDVGIGIAGEVETSLIIRFDVGYSKEGIGTTFTLGKEL